MKWLLFLLLLTGCFDSYSHLKVIDQGFVKVIKVHGCGGNRIVQSCRFTADNGNNYTVNDLVAPGDIVKICIWQNTSNRKPHNVFSNRLVGSHRHTPPDFVYEMCWSGK